jgi:hypothetical protein
MAKTLRRIEYYYATVDDKHGKGYWLLEHLRQKGINLLAFTAFPLGGGRSQLDFFPDNAELFCSAIAEVGIEPIGPKRAFFVQGEDKIGGIVEIHHKLAGAGINVYASNGTSSGGGKFGFVLWVNPDDYERAAQALGV